MRRVSRSRQYSLLIGVFGGLIILIVLMHNRTSPILLEPQGFLKTNYEELNRRLSIIEREIESQVRDSNRILNQIREARRLNLTLEQSIIQKMEGDRLKLAELRRVLDQEAHIGEVHSAGDQEVDKEKGNDIPNALVGDEDENGAHEILGDTSKEAVIAILLFVCNRPTVTRCLDKLLQHRPSKTRFPIILSQDCGKHEKTMEALNRYESEFTHIFQPDLSVIATDSGHNQFQGYYKIARHYRWALDYAFTTLNYSQVVIVEDDLEISPDFYEYFSATLPLLKKDPSLWCVSAWNDNGKVNRIDTNAPEKLYRTDFFPGLGWMLTKDLWKELGPKWPRGFWDDWMREPKQRQERACIRPEISRTSTFGQVGVSRGTYYDTHLKFIQLNNKFVQFSGMDLSYLTKANYDKQFLTQVNSATLITSIGEIATLEVNRNSEFRLEYGTNAGFQKLAKQLQIMDDNKAGVPRTAYLGIVTTMFSNHRIYITPNSKWKGYTS